MAPTLLVVEDSPVIGALVKKIVSRHDAEAVLLSAANGKEGIDLLKAHKPQAVILDWMMPDYGGKWFLEQQADDSEIADIPVIIHSAVSEAQIKTEISAFPAVKDYVQKPVMPAKLFSKLQGFLE